MSFPGVTCVETLAFLQPEEKIVLISESSLIKAVTNLFAITQTLTQFDIKETDAHYLTNKHSNVSVLHDKLVEINTEINIVKTENHHTIKYKYLCLCMGAKPKLIPQATNNPCVIGIRDTDSVDSFINKLVEARKVAIVGNGGIASELVYKINNASIDWIIKDDHITSTFVDPGASEFFQSTLTNKSSDLQQPTLAKRMRYEESNIKKSGAALGPDWYKHFNISGADFSSLGNSIKIHYNTLVNSIVNSKPVQLTLTNGEQIETDLVVSATGVEPELRFTIDKNFELSDDGCIKVNDYMQTNINNIYAAGDICSAAWSHAKHWFQMKLWTQARQMGCYAAKCMSAKHNQEEIYQDFCFELFAHTTKLFGYKVVLIGLFNGQKLGIDYEILLRMTKEVEYIKFVLQNNKLQGAVLIGDTDLEETCENLILNEIDLSLYKDDLLNPNIDIEDYFD